MHMDHGTAAIARTLAIVDGLVSYKLDGRELSGSEYH